LTLPLTWLLTLPLQAHTLSCLMRLLGVSLAGAILLAVHVSPAAASNPVPLGYSYAGYGSYIAANGIDGYVGYNNGNYNALGQLNDPDNQHILNWIGLYQDPSLLHPDWYQAGLYQGSVGHCPNSPCIQSPNAVRMYAEGNDQNQAYHLTDLGPMSTAPNEAFYVTTDGHKDPDTQKYIYTIRYGSWSSPVRDTYELAILVLPAWGLQELQNRSGAQMTVNTGYLGMTNVGGWGASQSYGLHLYSTSTGFHVWTPTYSGIDCYIFATCPVSDAPPTFHSVNAPWYSFYTTQ
jgi:hypothetical protein